MAQVVAAVAVWGTYIGGMLVATFLLAFLGDRRHNVGNALSIAGGFACAIVIVAVLVVVVAYVALFFAYALGMEN